MDVTQEHSEERRADAARLGRLIAVHAPYDGTFQLRTAGIWLITGAGRGMGADIARAALAAGNAVVATGRDTDRITASLGHSDNLLSVKLDVTSRADAEAVVRAAVDRFGRIDVLVNSAASFYAAYRDLSTSLDFDAQ